MKDILRLYNNGSSVKDISEELKITENQIRSYLKVNINWYNRSISDLEKHEEQEILIMYKNEFSVLEISDKFKISAPSIIKFLKANGIIRIYHSGRKYDILKTIPFSKKNKEFIIGTMLGDGCIRKSGKIPRLVIVHSKKFELYFHWKLSQMDKYFNLWREQIHPRKNSTLLYSETLQHEGLVDFHKMFYVDGIKVVPSNIDIYMTPYALSVWFLDDGTLNSGTNQRIHTNCFKYEDQLKLQSMIKRCFDLNCKILTRKDGQHILSFDKNNSNKLSNIIEPYVIPSMRYKLSLNYSSTTTRQSFE